MSSIYHINTTKAINSELGNLVVTSVKVDDDVWKEAKIQAIRKGITTAEFLNEALRREIQRSKTKDI